jgi:hypothetical protein
VMFLDGASPSMCLMVNSQASWYRLAEPLTHRKGKHDADHSILLDRLLETAVEAHIQAQGTKPKGFSTALQFTKIVNSSTASNG